MPESEKKSISLKQRQTKILAGSHFHGVPANFRPLQTPKGIISGILIHLGKSGIIEAGIDEEVRALREEQSGKAGVDKIRGLLADAVNPDQAHIVGPEE